MQGPDSSTERAYLEEASVEHPVIEPREPLLQLQPHADRPAAAAILRLDAQPEELHPPLAEDGHSEPVGGGRAAGGTGAGLDAVDAHAVEDPEGGDEPGGLQVVDEQLRPGPCENARRR
jgi:hypothetical protein